MCYHNHSNNNANLSTETSTSSNKNPSHPGDRIQCLKYTICEPHARDSRTYPFLDRPTIADKTFPRNSQSDGPCSAISRKIYGDEADTETWKFGN